MNKVIIIVFSLLLLLGCNQKKEVSNYSESVEVDSLSEKDSKPDFSNSRLYVDPETGDSLYLDFYIDNENVNAARKFEQGYIVTSYTSYKNDDKFQEELARWQELEANTRIETFGLGITKKYFISLGKYETKEEVISAYQKFKEKYPDEKIDFQYITQ